MSATNTVRCRPRHLSLRTTVKTLALCAFDFRHAPGEAERTPIPILPSAQAEHGDGTEFVSSLVKCLCEFNLRLFWFQLIDSDKPLNWFLRL